MDTYIAPEILACLHGKSVCRHVDSATELPSPELDSWASSPVAEIGDYRAIRKILARFFERLLIVSKLIPKTL
ncbi:MAG: hypothetical protein KUG74_11450 [Rhodobacteraceae bacterium]|nr:hypothetical protein [Paracoccaceae bacterium]